jgi:uroporphyrinogen-III synthase
MPTIPRQRQLRALVTRPRDEADRLAAALAARGLAVVLEPLIEIVARNTPPPRLAGVQAILCTSANGVGALARRIDDRAVPIFAVGEATAARARGEGFARVETAAGDVDALARLVRERLDPDSGRLVHAAGSAVAGDLSGMLAAAGFAVERSVLYDARPAAALTTPTARLISDGLIDLALFFSPRTAAIFARLVDAAGIGDGLRASLALSISRAADTALGALPFGERLVAGAPNQAALLDLVDRHCCEPCA